jgi:bifunctional non-homologous end joining protein LigD
MLKGQEGEFEYKVRTHRLQNGDEVWLWEVRQDNRRVPRIAAAVAALPVVSVTLDGECVMARPDGVTDFDAVRVALSGRHAPQAFLYSFDLMELDGRDLRREALETRRAVVEHLIERTASPGILVSEHADYDGRALYRHACKLGLEGIISKRRDSRYVSGRCTEWIKVKNPDAPAASRSFE